MDRSQAERYKARHEYWLRRVTELANGSPRHPHPKSAPGELHIHRSDTGPGDSEPMGIQRDG